MYLTKLRLTNYRNYVALDLSLPPGPLILCGDNAQGKSNLLDAIYLLATTKSSRASGDRQLVRWQAMESYPAMARVAGDIQRADLSTSVDIGFSAEVETLASDNGKPSTKFHKQTRVNGIPRRTSDVIGILNVVLFTPQDVELVAGSPSQRRRYLDIMVSQIDQGYLRSLQRYGRILIQRNHLLKLIREGKAQITQTEIWDQQLVEEASYIYLRRRDILRDLSAFTSVIYGDLSGGAERLSLIYTPNPLELNNQSVTNQSAVAEIIYSSLVKNVDRQISQGMTVVGPHRDDIQFLIGGRDMGIYGSRGQQRSIVAALKLAEAKFMVSKTGEDPVLLLDDVLSELDSPRRSHILQKAMTNQQTIVTTTNMEAMDNSFISSARVFKVSEGTISVGS